MANVSTNVTVEVDDSSVATVFEDILKEWKEWDKNHRHWFIIFNILRVTAGLLGIAAACFLMYIICRFKRLRSWINIYVFVLCLAHATYCAAESVFPAAYGLVSNRNWISASIVRHTWPIADGGFLVVTLVAFLLGLQWCFATFRPSLAALHEKWYRVVLGAIIGVYFLVYVVSYVYSFRFISEFVTYFYLAVLAVITAVNITRCFVARKELAADCLVICNIVVFCHGVYTAYLLLEEFFFLKSSILRAVTTFTKFVPRVITSCITVFVLLKLVSQNKYFKQACRSVLGRKEVSDLDKSMEDLIDEEEQA